MRMNKGHKQSSMDRIGYVWEIAWKWREKARIDQIEAYTKVHSKQIWKVTDVLFILVSRKGFMYSK
jgi:hypothetical protein